MDKFKSTDKTVNTPENRGRGLKGEGKKTEKNVFFLVDQKVERENQ